MEQSDHASTVEKALDVLFHLHARGGSQGVTGIGRALGLPKSTAHRLLAALRSRGLVERDERGRYRPGTALLALGLGVLEHEPVVAAAGPVLESVAHSLGETAFLAAARAGRLRVLDKREGSGFLRAAPRVGAEIPVHATATGKLYLALAPEAVAFDPRRLETYTPRTIAAAARIEHEVAEVRARGWAENREEWIAGLSGVAAPVLTRGRMAAAVAVAGPSARISRDALAPQLLAAASRIAARLEGRSA